MRLVLLACVLAFAAAQTSGSTTCPTLACAVKCDNGFVKDEKNCDTCRCACPKPTCSTTCNTFAKDSNGCDTCDCARAVCPTVTTKCDYGNAVDENGCATDKCNPPPTVCPAVMCAMYCVNGFEVDVATGCQSCICKRPTCTPCNTLVACRYGYKYDENGCQTCACNDPPPTCSGVVCALYCEFGYVKDANGCDTCTCAKPVCPTCATFAACRNGYVKDPKTGCDTCQCAPDTTCPAVACIQICEFGTKRDDKGCETCDCLPDPNPCPQVLCFRACPYGSIKDKNGCETCDCVAAPTDCTSVGINSNPTDASRQPCAIRCMYGLDVDPTTKCQICSCAPPPPCPQVRCANQCPNGFVYDKQGCQTCQCITRADVCTLTASAGSCKAAIDAWAFDSKTRKCVKFTWGGCDDGNANRFDNVATCEKTCLPPVTVVIKIDASATLTADQADAVTKAIAEATGAERVALDSSKAGEITIFVYDGTLTTKQVETAVKGDIAKNDSTIKTAAGGQAVNGAEITGETVTASPANAAAPMIGVLVALFAALRFV